MIAKIVATYRRPVADCVELIFTVSQVIRDTTNGPKKPKMTRAQRKNPPIPVNELNVVF